MTIETTADLIEYANEIGHNYFSPGTMDFFQSEIEPEIFAGRYFVSSEQERGGHWYNGERRWTIREFSIEDGKLSIDTVGEMGAFCCYEDARKSLASVGGN